MNELATQQAGTIALDPAKVALIKAIVARDCTDSEFALLMHLSARYNLDPLARQIWAVKYGSNPAQIFVGRDGYLAVAHASGQFNGMESGTRKDGDTTFGWAKVYRKDMAHPFTAEVALSEYTTGKNLWVSKPLTMIQKVAEAQALRRAFAISGVYSPEELPEGPALKEVPYSPTVLEENHLETSTTTKDNPMSTEDLVAMREANEKRKKAPA